MQMLARQIDMWSEQRPITRHVTCHKKIQKSEIVDTMPVLKFAELVTNSIGDPKTRFQNTKRDVLPALPHKSIPRKIPSVTRNIEEFEEASHVERTHESTTKQSTTKQRATKYIAQAKFIPTQDKVIYTPKQVIKDGFEYRVPTPITSKYLLFPPPESTSIIYHCRQGDLFRKREAIVETVVETVVEPAQDPVEERQPDRMDSQDDLSYNSNPIQVPGSWLSRWFTPIPSHWIVSLINIA
jgi:hypothetical protein